MFITKMSLPRRTFLRGAGAVIALPLLDAMVPALTATAKTAAKPAPRMGFFYVPNGMYMPEFVPKTVGKNFEMPSLLRPLDAFKDQVVVVTGTANTAIELDGVGSGPHTKCGGVWLHGNPLKRTEGADIHAGTTVDQLAARELCKDTQLTSLELALESSLTVGNCTGGYSCAYINTFSWSSPTTPLHMENNPRAAFERLFGDGVAGAARVTQLQQNRSILDWVKQEMTGLQQTLGPRDRTTVSEYLDAIRDVERRIQKAEEQTDLSEAALTAPLGIPPVFEDHFRLMADLQLLAYQADITRVTSLQIAREQSERTYAQIGADTGHHEISHMGTPERTLMNAKINTHHVGLFAYLVDKMRKTPDGDGSLLDHSLLLYGSGMGDGGRHSPHNLPVVLVGGAAGRLEGNRHIAAPLDTPFMNVGVSILHKVGVNVEKVGDSTGEIAGL
jgi:hypothetical protein